MIAKNPGVPEKEKTRLDIAVIALVKVGFAAIL